MHSRCLAGAHRTRRGFSILSVLWVCIVLMAQLDSVLLLPHTVFGFRLSYFRLALVALSLVTFAAFLRRGYARVMLRNPTVVLYCTWFAWTILSGLWTSDGAGYFRYIALAVMYTVLIFAIPMAITSKSQYQFFVNGLLAFLLAAIALGVYESSTGFRLIASRQWQFRNEVTSFFVNPAHFSATLSVFSPMVLQHGFSRLKQSLIGSILIALVTVVGLYLIVHTGSRGAVIALGVAISSVMMLSIRNVVYLKKLLMLFLIGGVLALIVVPLLPEIPVAILDKLASLGRLSEFVVESDRAALMGIASTLWQDSPVLGLGAGAAESILERLDPFGGVYSLHSWAFELLVNTGLIGFILFAAFYCSLLIALLKARKQAPDSYTKVMSACLLSGLLAFVPISFTLGSLMTFPLFWVYIGLCICFLRLLNNGGFHATYEEYRSSTSGI